MQVQKHCFQITIQNCQPKENLTKAARLGQIKAH